MEQDKPNNGDLKGMKQWAESLTYESLVNALEFSFQIDEDDHIPGGIQQQKCNGTNFRNSGSHEFDLLMEMASLQYSNRNGQLLRELGEVENCYGWRRSVKAKLETPCLFRWTDLKADRKRVTNKTSTSSKQVETKPDPCIGDPVASLDMATAGIPSELLNVLAKAGVKRSTSDLLQTFNEADEIVNVFESLDGCQNNLGAKINTDNSPLPTNYHIESNQWIANDGSSLGRGSTIEQQNADRSIILWTTLVLDRKLGANEEDSPEKSIPSLPRCRLNIPGESPHNNQQYKMLVLDTLRVASRGKFLSEAGRQKHKYLAPWFDPTQHWFSLPMYLANRFEVSLRDAYVQRNYEVQPTNEFCTNSLVHSVKNLDEGAIRRVLSYALWVVMRDDINLQKENYTMSQFPPTDSIQDSLLWKLFLWGEIGNTVTRLHWQKDAFATTSLLEWDTPRGELKSLIMSHLRMGLAHEAERSLMQSMQPKVRKRSKAGKKRKKRPKKKGGNVKQFAKAKLGDAQSQDGQNSDDDEPQVDFILPSTPQCTLTDCEADHSPQSENNSTKMTVLKVIDNILQNVFQRVGVQDDGFSDFTDAMTVKCGELLQREFKSQSVDKTLSADDIELATTALMSNRAGASTDDVMNFLQRTDHCRNRSQAPVQSQQLCASRSRRQTHEGGSQQKKMTYLKRSKSSGDGSMTENKPPVYPSKIHQPAPEQSDYDNNPIWPSSDSPSIPQASQSETSIFDGAPLCLSGALDGWNSVACQNKNETNIFTNLKNNDQVIVNSDYEQQILLSSTAASIASSRENAKEAGLDFDGESSPLECDDLLEGDESLSFIDINKAVHFEDIKVPNVKGDALPVKSSEEPSCEPSLVDAVGGEAVSNEGVDPPLPFATTDLSTELSPTPSAPPTPPQLSPILVSLADLGKLRERAASGDYSEKSNGLSPNPLPLSSTPKPPTTTTVSRTLTPSLSRDDLRSIDACRKPPRRDRDDHHTMGHRQVDALLSYRNVVAQSVPRKPTSLKSYDGKQKLRDDAHPILARSSRSIKTTRSGMWPPGPEFPSLSSSVSSMPSYKEPILNKVLHLDVACARSEGGLDGADDASHCNVIPRAQTDETMTKDGATTISSVHSPPETEQFTILKEERNSYRDMCLTLGAENAKLRNLLASKTCTPLFHPASFTQETSTPYFYHNDQQFWPVSNGYPNQFSTQSIVAMSDAGIHRGDYDSSAMSEDGTDIHPTVVAIAESNNSLSWQARGDSVQSFGRRTSGGGTYTDSDTSLDFNAAQEPHALPGFHRVHQQDAFFGPIPLHGMQSRLSKDITRYMQALKSQLKNNEPRRLWAIKQLELAVKALWPRAQIKMYGSHVTKLCLPSSDMDFVISLPAVHKNAPAMAPGDLEGRNAIVETNQKVLARKLKSESWIDQRSIKVIERTAVPVIKVSTKDSRCRVVQLDLSFDAKEHHGLDALNMIQHILEQLPMVRPLVLVLKQFLLDRGLLTAYTGGLSSYCLFLMVARYCQEQAPTWNDCGSLLMGLLDFYGNFFDPRTTGISVRTRQYFFRSQDAQHSQQSFPEAQGWNTPHQTQFPDLTKRNGFSSKTHRFQPLHRQFSFQSNHTNMSQAQQFKSGKFDPIWVEDPLNPGNNVGRNAFRIFQVQRAFSDAHRGILASLEWDINSMHEFGDDGEYPLLKCLLQNEDVFFSIDDPIHR